MSRHFRYILFLIPLSFGIIIFELYAPDHSLQKQQLQNQLITLTKQTSTLKALSKNHRPDALKNIQARHRAFKKDPKECLKAWGLEHHVTLTEITSHSLESQTDLECAFTAPLDMDVFAFIKDLEKNNFKIKSLGLYRDKVLNTIQGRLVLTRDPQKK